MRINKAATIAKDPYKKSAYFLSLLEGPNVEGWLACQDECLDKVDVDPTILPWHMNKWEVLESEFKKLFTDYAEQERANEELQQLMMQSGNIDGYIAHVSQLAHRGGHNIDEPFVTQLFAQGLPKSLMESCFDLHNPKTFKEWALSAQRDHKVWLKKQATKGSFNTTQPKGQPSPNPKGQFYWWWGNQGGQGQGQTNNNGSKSQWHGSNPRQLGPIDSNAMEYKCHCMKSLYQRRKTSLLERGAMLRMCKNWTPCTTLSRQKASCQSCNWCYSQRRNHCPRLYWRVCQWRNIGFGCKLNDEAREAFVKRIIMAGEEMVFS